MEKIKSSEKVTNEQFFERLGEKRTLLNNIARIKAHWIGLIMIRNCLLHGSIDDGSERITKNKAP